MSDEFSERQSDLELDDYRREAERTRREVKELEHELKEANKTIGNLEREFGLISSVGVRIDPPAWLRSTRRSAKRHWGTPWLALSDLHLDEVVRPEEVLGINAFNRRIAGMRLRNTFENAVTVATEHWSGVDYHGIVAPMMGDIFSGIIHEELKVTNEDTIFGSLDYWLDPMAEGITFLAEEFGKVHVPVVVGNHGRNSRKPVAKLRARDNFDWFFGRILARMLKDDKRITFDISDSADLIVPSYDRNVMVTHMDQTRGGGGIGGIWPPIMRLDAKKRARQAAVGQPYQMMIGGHWHTLTFGPDWIINGSLKGYDEYAFQGNFGFEIPQQAMWLMTPEHGKTWTAPVFCMEREKEGW